jgi:S-adenosylmethionine-diacylgycerolhomoserine-N-methlytransferase
MSRYGHIGSLYDVVSLEAILYRRPRAALARLLGPMPGATVIDLGCGTGLNFGWLHNAVAPDGRIIGIDDSPSMLAAARRRIDRCGWADVTLARADITRLDDEVRATARDADAFVATFVLSLLGDDAACWSLIDDAACARPVRVALADLGDASHAPRLLRPALWALTSLGGGRVARCPWNRLTACADDVHHEEYLGGHVHLAAGTCRCPPAPR